MKLFVSDIVKSYKDTFVDHLVNSGPEDLLLRILKCWNSCVVDKENISLCLCFCTFQVLCINIIHVLVLSQSTHNAELKEIHY